MKQPKSPLAAYNTALGTRPPLHVIVGLYDLAIIHIVRAADAAEQRDYERQFNEAMRAAQVLNGLSGCLDMKRGGNVAVSLREMYQTVIAALLRSVGKKQATIASLRLAEAVRLTRNAWAEIAHLPQSVKPLEITRLCAMDPMEKPAETLIPAHIAPQQSSHNNISLRQPRGLRARNNPL